MKNNEPSNSTPKNGAHELGSLERYKGQATDPKRSQLNMRLNDIRTILPSLGLTSIPVCALVNPCWLCITIFNWLHF